MISRIKDPVSALTHMAGAVASIFGLVLLIYAAVARGNTWHLISFTIFGASLILLYTASTLYHLLPLSEVGTRRLKRLDHMMIYVLIAGTYTPFCLVALRGPWGWSLFAAVWGIALLGMGLKMAWLYAPRWITVAFYLAMGWLVVIAGYPMMQTVPAMALVWLMIGGLFYSVGAVIYATKWPDPLPGRFGFHEIWHLFVMAGSLSHFWSIFRYLPGLS